MPKERPETPGQSHANPVYVKAILQAGRPLTIACHIKNYFFLVVSAAILLESAAILLESADILEESALTAEESVLTAEESAALASALELLQAAKAAIAATNKNFFICDCFLRLLNGSVVNTTA
jgi:hypothetical protein